MSSLILSDVYHKKYLLFLTAICSIFKYIKKALGGQSLENILLIVFVLRSLAFSSRRGRTLVSQRSPLFHHLFHTLFLFRSSHSKYFWAAKNCRKDLKVADINRCSFLISTANFFISLRGYRVLFKHLLVTIKSQNFLS